MSTSKWHGEEGIIASLRFTLLLLLADCSGVWSGVSRWGRDSTPRLEAIFGGGWCGAMLRIKRMRGGLFINCYEIFFFFFFLLF